MHQKKIPRVKNILHSIPILCSSGYTTNSNNRSIVIKNKHLRYVSSSIPLVCSVALLLLSICIVNPSSNPFISHSNVYAEDDSSSSSSDNVSSRSASEPDPIATLNITGDLTQTNNTGPNQTVYRTHGIKVNLQDVTDYTLQVSYANGSNSLVYEGTNTGNNTITGANNIQGSSLNTNTWGYAWSDNDKEDDANLYYQTMPTYGSTSSGILKNESVTGTDEVLTKTVNGKLVFAAKFADDAPYGHYKTSVLLSLAATPKKVVADTNIPVDNWNDVEYMQQMSAAACASIGTASAGNYPSKTLVDSRDGNEYTITKLDDQNCWMTQNLRLVSPSEDNKITLTSVDSNVSSDYDVPASSSPWQTSSSSGNAIPTLNKVHYKGNTTNGANYTWYTATAGTQGDSYSICPRGWKLPSLSEYQNFLTKAGINYKHFNGSSWSGSSSASDSTKIRGAPYNFPYAGYVYSGSLRNVGSGGNYWSSTASGSNNAYSLYFLSSDVNTYTGFRYYGLSVRCIADNQPKDENEAIEMTEGFGGIKKLQDMTSDICSQSSIPNGTTGQLYDSRDLSIYDVAKLNDGKCWMTQNLRITGDSIKAKDPNNTTGTITSADSNVSSNYNIPASSEPWSDNSATTNKVHYAGNTTNGANYTWYTATASTQGSNYSICPRGWKLPTIAQYETLLSSAGISDDKAGSAKIRGTPYNFPYAGYVDSGSLRDVGSGGSYWSSTASDNNVAYGLNFNSSNVNTNPNDRYYGLSVRCIAP